MKVTYIHHSGFLVETRKCYYLFDYENGQLPPMDTEKPIFVLSSHSHGDHYNPEVFTKVSDMQRVYGVLSEDITPPDRENILQVCPEKEYVLDMGQSLTTFRSTDMGVAFLLEDGEELIYHAGDLNDWVWEEESSAYNAQMTADYRRQLELLAEKLNHRQLDAAFVVLDPRQGKDYDRGLCRFLERIPAKKVFPMHYWDEPSVIDKFLQKHPQYYNQIQKTEETALGAERGSL